MHIIKRHIVLSSFLAGLAAVSGSALAQEEEGPSVFTYATYFYCDVSGQERADEIVKSAEAPVYDKMVAEGKMSGWGWLAHHTGGKWRRIQYHTSDSVAGLLKAQEVLAERAADLIKGIPPLPADHAEVGLIDNWQARQRNGKPKRHVTPI